MNFRFPKSVRLLSRSQFQRLQNHVHRYIGRWVVIEYRQTHKVIQPARLGITVTRRYGKSHERNRFKRLVREAFRLLQDRMRKGLDLVIKPKERYQPLSLYEIKQDLLAWLEAIEES